MEGDRFDWGLVGLGVMGQNPALNIGGQGTAVAGYDLDRERAAALDPGSAGHYVKMVHNGIEYGLMQPLRQPDPHLRPGVLAAPGSPRVHGYGLELERVAAIWRGGCIIRARLLEPIRAAFRRSPGLASLAYLTQWREEE